MKFSKIIGLGVLCIGLLAWSSDARAGWGSWGGSHGGSGGSWGGGSGGSWGGSSGGSWGGGSGGSWGGSSGGSWGASYSSYGSSGGSWGSSGSRGSHGGGLFARIHARIHAHRARKLAYASYGSNGSQGSYGSYGSQGSVSVSYGSGGGSWGSSGGASGGSSGWNSYSEPAYSEPMYSEPAHSEGVIIDDAPMMEGAAPVETPMAPAPDESTRIDSTDGMLTVSVPSDAQLVINGHKTKATGRVRQFMSKGLKPGYRYPYEVKAILERDGQVVTDTKKVRLRAGSTSRLAFEFARRDNVETKLTLNVPKDAKVLLAGTETQSTGEVRVFSTSNLGKGAVWSNYTVQVSVVREGQTLNKQQTIDLRAGDSRDLTFDFDAQQVASR